VAATTGRGAPDTDAPEGGQGDPDGRRVRGLTLPAWLACVVVVTWATTRVAVVALDPGGVVLVVLVVLVAAAIDLRLVLRT
jgi:hypothetical protein